jgi:hypothetical protein
LGKGNRVITSKNTKMMKITIYYARSCLNSTKVLDMASLSRILEASRGSKY